MKKTPSKENVADLDVARNKKKSKEGRLKNLAFQFVERELDKGPFYASMWLYTEFQRQDVEDMEAAYNELAPYIEERRKGAYI